MSTKNTNLSVYTQTNTNLLWYTFVKYKVISYEEKLYINTVSLIQDNKKKLLKDLDLLRADSVNLTNKDLEENTLKLSELYKNVLNIDNLLNKSYESFNKLISDLYNTHTIDLIIKYKDILIKNDFNNEFIMFTNDVLLYQTKTKFLEQKLLDVLVTIFNKSKHSKSDRNLFIQTLLSNKLRDKLNTFNKKLTKLKKRKKHIFKKVKFLKKFYKINLLRKKKNYFFPTYFNFLQIFKKKLFIENNILFKKIPLSQIVVLKSNLEIFYNFNKHNYKKIKKTITNKSTNDYSFKNKFRIYLRNFHQKPYWKLRTARIVHWNLFYNKTIRKQRYKLFINKFKKNYTKLSYNYFLFINFFFKTYISWTRLGKLTSFIKLICIQKNKNILKLPIFISKNINWNILKKKNYILKKKIGKWSYLNYKRFQQPWLQSKKNYPKYINHSEPNKLNSLINCSWDIITSTIYLHKQHHLFTFPTKDNFKVNWQIKLHMYRYKSNNCCLLLNITC